MSRRYDFAAMRADLIRRGLLTAGGALTEAGHDYCDRLLAQLPQSANCQPVDCPVFWKGWGASRAWQGDGADRRS